MNKLPSTKHVKTPGTTNTDTVPMSSKQTKRKHVASLEVWAKNNEDDKKCNHHHNHSKFVVGSCKMAIIVLLSIIDQYYYLKLPLKAIPLNLINNKSGYSGDLSTDLSKTMNQKAKRAGVSTFCRDDVDAVLSYSSN